MEYGTRDILELIGSLGLFLFGMKVMSDALLQLAGNSMRAILARLTSNRVLGIFTGFMITSAIQSSSATTLMVVSFSNAGLLTLPEAISVIMGANIGTTITAWLITILGFKVSMSALALPLVGIGFALTFAKKERLKHWGTFIVGFALLFIGLEFLKDAMPDLNENPGILEFLNRYTEAGFASVLLFLLIGTLLTVIVQSSSATMALTLIMTAQGWIPFEMAAAMVLGENIGTTITANLAAIVGNFQAKRTARAHLIFNLIGVVWMLVVFYPFLKLISWLTTRLGEGDPYANALAVPVAISLFHTIFNCCNTFLLAWFVKPIAHLVERFVPEVAVPERTIDEPKFLKKSMLKYPETAIATLELETDYLFRNAIFEIVTHALNITRTDVRSDLKAKKIVKRSKEDFKTDVRALYLSKVKTIYGEIIRYATLAQSQLKLTEPQNHRISQLKLANRRMVEIIRDVGELNRNVSRFIDSENPAIRRAYDRLRQWMIKVLRAIYKPVEPDSKEHYHKMLLQILEQVKYKLHEGHLDVDQLIREDKITTEMMSSLINDQDHVHELTNKLIAVAEILYVQDDPLTFLQNGDNEMTEPVEVEELN